jgi:hypothetical protein
MHYKKASKFAAVTIPGVGVVQGDTVLTGSQYEKFVGLGLLEPWAAPSATPAKAAPAAPAPVVEPKVDAPAKVEETGEDGPDTRPAAKKTTSKR